VTPSERMENAVTRQLNAMHTGPRREDWETPPELFAPLHAEFGFTLDVCASAGNAKVPDYYDRDALDRPWRGVCWMNPPYGKQIGQWVRKAWEESQRGATVVCLIPARTDAGWWHEYAMRGEVRFIRRRIRFVGAPYNAPFPSAIVVFRPPEQQQRAA
jgi:phage N-6-adenine-methyltransferase